jgi:recombination protein RecA
LSAWGPSASLTLAIDLVLEAQQQGEPVAWISTRESSFFPPDAAANGVDLGALPVVHANSGRTAGRAADRLLRSGAFALIIIDLGRTERGRTERGRTERGRAVGAGAGLPLPLQSRLLQLALKHDAAVLFLTEKPSTAPSLGSLVSLRAQARRRKTGPGRYTCELLVLKDKRHGPGWQHDTFRNGPPGLR